MKLKKLLLSVVMGLLPLVGYAQGGQRIYTALQTTTGSVYAQVIPNASISVCQYNSSLSCVTPVSIYSDVALTKLITQPLIANSQGVYTYYTTAGTQVVEKVCAPYNQCQSYPVLIGGGAGGGLPFGNTNNVVYYPTPGYQGSAAGLGNGLSINSGVLNAFIGCPSPGSGSITCSNTLSALTNVVSPNINLGTTDGRAKAYQTNTPCSGNGISGLSVDASNNCYVAASTTLLEISLVTGSTLATNSSPFTSLPSGVNHIGSIEVCGAYLCVAIANNQGSNVTQQLIALYNISDLSFHSYIDISASSDDNAGVAYNPNNNTLVVCNYYGSGAYADVWNFQTTTGSGTRYSTPTLTFSTLVPQCQGISYDQVRNLYVISQDNPSQTVGYFWDVSTSGVVTADEFNGGVWPFSGEMEAGTSAQGVLMYPNGSGLSYAAVPGPGILNQNLSGTFVQGNMSTLSPGNYILPYPDFGAGQIGVSPGLITLESCGPQLTASIVDSDCYSVTLDPVNGLLGPGGFGVGPGRSPYLLNTYYGWATDPSNNGYGIPASGNFIQKYNVTTWAQTDQSGPSAGAGYTTANGVATTTSGIGTGLTLNITASGGSLTSTVSVASGGTSYATGDFVYPTQGGGSGGVYYVSKQSGGVVSTVTLGAANASMGTAVMRDLEESGGYLYVPGFSGSACSGHGTPVYNNATIGVFNTTTGLPFVTSYVLGGGIQAPTGVAIDYLTNTAYVADLCSDSAMYTYNATTWSFIQTVSFSSAFNGPRGMSFSATNGDLLVCDLTHIAYVSFSGAITSEYLSPYGGNACEGVDGLSNAWTQHHLVNPISLSSGIPSLQYLGQSLASPIPAGHFGIISSANQVVDGGNDPLSGPNTWIGTQTYNGAITVNPLSVGGNLNVNSYAQNFEVWPGACSTPSVNLYTQEGASMGATSSGTLYFGFTAPSSTALSTAGCSGTRYFNFTNFDKIAVGAAGTTTEMDFFSTPKFAFSGSAYATFATPVNLTNGRVLNIPDATGYIGFGLSTPLGTPTYATGTNITSVGCASGFTCINTSGELTIVANSSATTGTIATVTFSNPLTAAVVGATGGTGYVTGDTVTFTCGSSNAIATVTASSGVVTSLLVTTPGTGCSSSTNTSPASTSGIGTGLQANLTAGLTAAPNCTVFQNGGTTNYILGHGTPTTTGFTITAGVSVASATIHADYTCGVN